MWTKMTRFSDKRHLYSKVLKYVRIIVNIFLLHPSCDGKITRLYSFPFVQISQRVKTTSPPHRNSPFFLRLGLLSVCLTPRETVWILHFNLYNCQTNMKSVVKEIKALNAPKCPTVVILLKVKKSINQSYINNSIV